MKLKELIEVLQANPGLRLHVVGHATIKKSSSIISGNSDAASTINPRQNAEIWAKPQYRGVLERQIQSTYK